MGFEDGHDQCPSCLGVEHLREALEDPCIHCNTIGKIQEFLAKLQPQPTSEVSEAGSEDNGIPSFSQPDLALFPDDIEEQSVSDKEPEVIDSDDMADGQSEGL